MECYKDWTPKLIVWIILHKDLLDLYEVLCHGNEILLADPPAVESLALDDYTVHFQGNLNTAVQLSIQVTSHPGVHQSYVNCRNEQFRTHTGPNQERPNPDPSQELNIRCSSHVSPWGAEKQLKPRVNPQASTLRGARSGEPPQDRIDQGFISITRDNIAPTSLIRRKIGDHSSITPALGAKSPQTRIPNHGDRGRGRKSFGKDKPPPTSARLGRRAVRKKTILSSVSIHG
ncbi:hypothetical protein BJ875DRAFT_520543 [Amylocarpus encephaloides]|uniref:Uncharacterized protein n=1 Tax=Amylocarpus encephaloides TaxID=45428 RepID=A0A9P7YPJ9_9HELO|nr:hypothetical protein BJ875DRAFT_520543 [Amylocarpus encephaloides]